MAARGGLPEPVLGPVEVALLAQHEAQVVHGPGVAAGGRPSVPVLGPVEVAVLEQEIALLDHDVDGVAADLAADLARPRHPLCSSHRHRPPSVPP